MQITLLSMFLSATVLASGSCSHKTTPSAPDHTALVQLETRGCRGYCPAFVLLFRNDGVLEYEGIRSVEKIGRDTVQLSEQELRQLQVAVRALGLRQYPERIESQVADAPTSTITVFDGNSQYGVTGSMDRPKSILDFELLLKNLAESKGLRVVAGFEPLEQTSNQAEITIMFSPEVNPGNFLMQFEEVKLQIVRRVSAENNWLVGYNPSQITETQLLEMLKGMKGVQNAAPVLKKKQH